MFVGQENFCFCNCYGLSVCVPCIQVLKPNPQCDHNWRRDLWEDLLDHNDGAPMNGISALLKEAPAIPLPLLP